MPGLVPDSGILPEPRANPPNCCPKDGGFREENEAGWGGGGLGWCAGTPIAIPPFCADKDGEDDGGAEEENGGTGGGEGEEEE